MAQVTAALVKQLREQTGAGMMDCKKALSENDGDIDAATDWLRKKGLAAAAKKAGRVAAEGLVGVKVDGTTGVVVEVNAETDFVARNETFQGFVRTLSGVALGLDGDTDALAAAQFPETGRSVTDEITHLVSTVGENMSLRRLDRLAVEKGAVAAYVHNALTDGLGKIGVLVALESEAESDALAAFGKQLAMHVAAANPQFLNRDVVDQSALDRERDVLAEQARATGKPEDIINKMVEGRLRKFYEEVVLLDQVFVIDGETKVSKAIEAKAKELGSPIVVKGFVKYVLGEGIERPETDFAAEVQAQVAG